MVRFFGIPWLIKKCCVRIIVIIYVVPKCSYKLCYLLCQRPLPFKYEAVNAPDKTLYNHPIINYVAERGRKNIARRGVFLNGKIYSLVILLLQS